VNETEVKVCRDEKEEKALEIVRHYVWWSLGAGLIPVPIVDMVALSGLQLKMIHEISKVYGVRFDASRGKAIIASLLGSFVPELLATLVATFLKALPTVGGLAGGTMVFFAGGMSWALGKVFILHFESGGTMLNFDPEQLREYFKAQFEEGRKVAASMNQKPSTPSAS
jgi:uncharacterized protein (DUF697 family)